MSEGNNEGQELDGLQKQPPADDGSQAQGDGQGQEPPQGNEQKPGVDDTVPESYDFKVPDGMELDKDLADEFSAVAKEMKLSQSKAEKFMGIGEKLTQKMQARFEDAYKEAQANQIKAYETMLNTDPEIGGAKLQQALLDANEAYDKFMSDDAAKLLSDAGLNKHPAIVKVFMEIGKQIKNDSIKGGNGTQHERTASDWFPEMSKQ